MLNRVKTVWSQAPLFYANALSQSASEMGSKAATFAVATYLFSITNNAWSTSIALFCDFLPALVLTPLAGKVADREQKGKILYRANMAQLAVSIFLLCLFTSKNPSIILIYCGLSALSFIKVFVEAVIGTLPAALVPRQELQRANAFVHTLGGFVELIAPLLGAALVTAVGPWGVFAIDAMTFFQAALIGKRIRISQSPIADNSIDQAESTTIATERHNEQPEIRFFGFKYLAGPKGIGLRELLALFAVGNIAETIYESLTAPFFLSLGSKEAFAIASTSFGLGTLLSGALTTILATRIAEIPKSRIILAGILVRGIALLAISQTRSLPLWISMMFVNGVFAGQIQPASNTIWSSRVEPEVQGKVFSARRLIAYSTLAIGYLGAGWLSEVILAPVFGKEKSYALVMAGLGVFNILLSFIGMRVRNLQILDSPISKE